MPDGQEAKDPWKRAEPLGYIVSDRGGENRYEHLRTEVRSLWSANYLYFLFIAPFDDITLNRDIVPDEHGDCAYIWDYDVVEIFIGDRFDDIRRYTEYVVSPICQKIDITYGLINDDGERHSDFSWSSV